MSAIPGVPPGTKIVAVRHFKTGERTIISNGSVTIAGHSSQHTVRPILAPENIYGQWLEEVPIPEGYERDGVDPKEGVDPATWWWRKAQIGELVLLKSGVADVYRGFATDPLIILRSKVQKRKYVVIDWGKFRDDNPRSVYSTAEDYADAMNGGMKCATVEERES